jgi:hypothetical protein
MFSFIVLAIVGQNPKPVNNVEKKKDREQTAGPRFTLYIQR